MRILVDIRGLTRPQASGVGEYTKNILRALLEIDKNNGYVLLSTGWKSAEKYARQAAQEISEGSPKVRHVHIRVPNKLLNVRTLSGLAPTIEKLAGRNFHLLFLPNLNITRIPSGLPTVLTVHDLSWKIFPHFFSRRMMAWHNANRPRRLIDQTTKIITPSESTKQDIEKIFHKPLSDITTIHHGIGKEFSPSEHPNDNNVKSKYNLPNRFVLFMGTLEPRKNVLTLIDGIEEYRKRTGNDLKLVLVGKWGWRSRELKKRISTLTKGGLRGVAGDQGWIQHLGYIDAKDRPALYRLADVFVWPSFYEGFGLPILESMASGTPVITSYTSSMPEITGKAAIHIDPYNHHDITVALEQLLPSSELQGTLINKGIEQAGSFSWKIAAEKTLEIFKLAVK